jgi:hypothetical protein
LDSKCGEKTGILVTNLQIRSIIKMFFQNFEVLKTLVIQTTMCGHQLQQLGMMNTS